MVRSRTVASVRLLRLGGLPRGEVIREGQRQGGGVDGSYTAMAYLWSRRLLPAPAAFLTWLLASYAQGHRRSSENMDIQTCTRR